MLKERGSEGGAELTSGKTLLYAAEASQFYPVLSGSHEVVDLAFLGAVTSILTNPIWVVKIRMFTTHPSDPTAYWNTWRTSPPYAPTQRLIAYPPHRRAINHIPNRRNERSLPRDSPGFGWREQRGATVHGVRTDQASGV